MEEESPANVSTEHPYPVGLVAASNLPNVQPNTVPPPSTEISYVQSYQVCRIPLHMSPRGELLGGFQATRGGHAVVEAQSFTARFRGAMGMRTQPCWYCELPFTCLDSSPQSYPSISPALNLVLFIITGTAPSMLP